MPSVRVVGPQLLLDLVREFKDKIKEATGDADDISEQLLVAWLYMLKKKRPEIYQRILQKNQSEHDKQLNRLFEKLGEIAPENTSGKWGDLDFSEKDLKELGLATSRRPMLADLKGPEMEGFCDRMEMAVQEQMKKEGFTPAKFSLIIQLESDDPFDGPSPLHISNIEEKHVLAFLISDALNDVLAQRLAEDE